MRTPLLVVQGCPTPGWGEAIPQCLLSRGLPGLQSIANASSSGCRAHSLPVVRRSVVMVGADLERNHGVNVGKGGPAITVMTMVYDDQERASGNAIRPATWRCAVQAH